ncbi:WxL protein peptidoglycan domain-containing protein [Actinoplanes sp. HUAS TT8]|uniref:WxL protein peptidoglycan domain-containing protein n=1 Tax=Actinoplanes sp. HUAS TT8 TaxID=3447453 RepID=UPI003F526BF7
MRRAVTALLATFIGIGLAGPAAAAPASGDGRVTFGVRPTGKTGPDKRSTFAYAATPGASVEDQVEVSNAGTRPITVRVYANDAFTTSGGGFDVLASGGKSADAGAWVTMSKGSVTVPARGRTVVPFTLRIPATATPGDHTAGIVASVSSLQTDAKGNKVSVDQRVGSRVYLRISGTLTPGITVEKLTAKYHPNANPLKSGRTTLTYLVRNTGNVRLGARQKVTVSTLWGGKREAVGIADVAEILPGDAVTMTAEVNGALPAVWLTGEVHADPLAQPGDQKLQLSAVTREYGFWAFSWTTAAVVFLIVVLIAGVLLNRRRRRRAVKNA